MKIAVPVKRFSDQDRRVRVISLTDRGRSVIEGALEQRCHGVEEALEDIEPGELAMLDRLLRRISEGLTEGAASRASES